MAWKITKTFLEGESRAKSRGFETHAAKATHRFRLYDDDNELYFEGVSTSDSSFAPLDSYGMPGFGCTSIRYWEKRNGTYSWRPL